jgi:hypothetical protein
VLGIRLWITRSSILSIAPATEFASRFLRTVILSRVLVPEEFGSAVAISVSIGHQRTCHRDPIRSTSIRRQLCFAASIPLVTSFSHLGIKQVQRNYVYLPGTLAIVFANISALLILVPAILIFHDHRAIIASFMTEASVYVVASHALAREQYLVDLIA